MMLCILIPLLVGLTCAYLGYLLGRSSCDDSSGSSKRIQELEADLAQCLKSKSAPKHISGNESMNFAKAASPVVALIPFNQDAAKIAFGKNIKENDLTIIEGIGPKISELFKNKGVTTWKALSECNVEKCQQVLNAGGKRFEIHKPGTWPDQAKLAYEGKWQELKKWQDELDGGK